MIQKIAKSVLLVIALFAVTAQAQIKNKYGTVIYTDTTQKVINLVFSADSTFEGAPHILDVLKQHNAKGNFFFTGNFLRMKEYDEIFKRIHSEGHYIGGHSNHHLLYAEWNPERTNLVTNDSLIADLRGNYMELAKKGVKREDAPYFMPPFEWYNAQNVKAINSEGITVICLSPHVGTSEDYTTPDMPIYRSSQQIIDKLFENEAKYSLNGVFMLIHPGTHPMRTDKLYLRLDEILTRLEDLGYTFKRL